MAEVNVGGLNAAVCPWALYDESGLPVLEHVLHVAPIAAWLQDGRCTAIREWARSARWLSVQSQLYGLYCGDGAGRVDRWVALVVEDGAAISGQPRPELVCCLVWEAKSPVVVGCHANCDCSAVEILEGPRRYVRVVNAYEIQDVLVVVQSERVAGLGQSQNLSIDSHARHGCAIGCELGRRHVRSKVLDYGDSSDCVGGNLAQCVVLQPEYVRC